ncbi:P-loop containing nucleoside triphosphate hydrolase protein [Ascodesmis nigricans]|uniref:Replication factor C subunit 2 n=1 Tax=Ascodesmis nigricans TaxID=341454 RepID=A0A4S2N2C7_9PEZI|nr:P-loop containing nucleoside triphosphate hydrolase protein [Ascodesmis nigricans]
MASSFFDLKARKAAAAAAAKEAVPTTAAKDSQRLVPWVEKYRPKSLSDVAAQDHTITVLKRTLQSNNLPHMLFYGPPGTGKTSTVLALAKELYGPELMKSRVLELNASDERGISIVREKVKNFARTAVSTASASSTSQYPCPPYKIIILDEADSMTQDAQSALRRTMETYSRITRFCLICNYVTRIIDPLASRCSKFRFKPLDVENARERLGEIAEKEGVRMEDGVVDALVRVADGDLRRAITYLQSAAKLHNPEKYTGTDEQGDVEMEDSDETSGKVGEVVTVRSVEEIAGVIPEDVIDELLKAMTPKPGRSVYPDVDRVVKGMVADGWNASQTVIQLYNKLVYDDVVTPDQKCEIVLVFSEVDKRLADGSDEHLQILDLALRISGIMAK